MRVKALIIAAISLTSICSASMHDKEKYVNKSRTNPVMTTENHSAKMYIEPSELYFSDEGIFLKTHKDEWKSIDYICHDIQGYYLVRSIFTNNPEICKNSAETGNNINEYDFDMDNKFTFYTRQGIAQELLFYEKDMMRFGGPVSQEPKKWKCPYCGYWWLMGEKCGNKECATNQWDKKDKAES